MTSDANPEELTRKGGGNPTIWMITFADLLSLILTFFVLLYATQQIEQAKWKKMRGSFTQQFSLNQEPSEIQSIPKSLSQVDEPIAINLDYLQSVLSAKFSDMPEFTRNRVRRYEDRLIISFPAEGLFGSSDFLLSQTAKSEIDKLAIVLGTIGNRIELVSYIGKESPGKLVGGWEYSIRRASVMADEFKRSGYVDSIAAFGLGNSRTEPGKTGTADSATRNPDRIDLVVREMSATE